MANPTTPRRKRFGDFEADLVAGELRKDGLPEKILLQDQPLQILRALVARPGEMVSREELIQLLWNGNTNVDFDPSLNKAVNRLRESLGDSAEAPRYIETLSRRGYRLIPTVENLDGATLRHARLVRTISVSSALLVLVAVILLGLNVRRWHEQILHKKRSASGKIMLAVLPFENIGNDPRQEYFADGMTEEMISQLGRLQPERLGVIARGSVMTYKHHDQSANRVAKELGVQYILEGSVRQEGQQVRITAQLIQASDQTHLWTQDYDGDLGNILLLQSKVARDVAGVILLNLSQGLQAASGTNYSVDPEALQLYLRGRYHLNRIWNTNGDTSLKTAVDFFELAIAKDPKYAPAHAGLAEARMWPVQFSLYNKTRVSPEPVYEEARTEAEKALRLDDSLADAHIALALYLESQWDIPAMEREAKTATQQDPNYVRPHEIYGLMLMHLGRLKEAFDQMQLAATLDPRSLHSLNFIGVYYLAAKQPDKAIEASQAAIKLDPDFLLAYLNLTDAYVQKHMYEEAIQANAAGLLRTGQNSAEVKQWFDRLRRAYRKSGPRALYLECVQIELEHARRVRETENLVAIAGWYAQAGETDQAFTWLEKGYRRHAFAMITLKSDYDFENLHSDPRWNDLLRRVGLLE